MRSDIVKEVGKLLRHMKQAKQFFESAVNYRNIAELVASEWSLVSCLT
jgi:hypothetical protein